MGDGNVFVEGGERPGQRGRRVALDHHQVGPLPAQELAEPLHQTGRQIGELLAVAHHVEGVPDVDPQQPQHLVEHLAVLAGGHDDRLELRTADSARASGASLIASGRVPSTSMARTGAPEGNEGMADIGPPMTRTSTMREREEARLRGGRGTAAQVRAVLSQVVLPVAIRHSPIHPAANQM